MMTQRSFLKIFYSMLLGLLLCGTLQAQTDSVYTGTTSRRDSAKRKPPRDYKWMEKFTYGTNLQLQFGTFTFIYISPTIGYMPFRNFDFGGGFVYNYASLNYGPPYGKVSQSIYGPHTYVRYFVKRNLFLMAQFDKLRQPDIYSYIPDRKTWVNYGLVGIGLRQPIGNKTGLSISLMYNLTQSDLSIYGSPVILQFGFMGVF